MSCTIATLAACFSMSGFYVDGSLSALNYGEGHWEAAPLSSTHGSDAWMCHGVRCAVWDTTAQNPYARVALGYSIEFRTLEAYVEAGHQSSTATGRDRGFEWVEAGVRWRPFR